MSDITELKKTLFSYYDNHQTIEMSKSLSMIWSDPSFSLDQKLDILGELTSRDPEYFMENIYPYRSTPYPKPGAVTLYKFIAAQHHELVKLEEYILKNYCFLEGEDIKTVFHGTLGYKKTVTLGRIYLTNYRLIVSGEQTVRSAQSQMGRSSIVSVLVRSGITRHRKAINRAILKAFRKDLTGRDIGEWGYYVPIHNAKNIKRKKDSVSYAIDLETEKKPITLKITIFPRKLKRQPKGEFQEQRENALNQIEDLLKHYQ